MNRTDSAVGIQFTTSKLTLKERGCRTGHHGIVRIRISHSFSAWLVQSAFSPILGLGSALGPTIRDAPSCFGHLLPNRQAGCFQTEQQIKISQESPEGDVTGRALRQG
ncbi:hypothetical protein NDU88_006381 [Pleurodeles waltl]|uniref:Uncharacterized protein n=1 Tax=Pleurodeles waltl TaxID=8319 RepID=A0AAV7UKU4_PLEWA|nr:hypothetical protein NDU88_006381 [Pleurodeles waltl]